MAVRIVRLGSDRARGEGLRLGTVRRPPRGIRKQDIARKGYYDVWVPELSPSQGLVKMAQAATTPAAWRSFTRRYRAEMGKAPASRILNLLAALSRETDFSVGCYCEDESHCHRSVLGELLAEHGALMKPGA